MSWTGAQRGYQATQEDSETNHGEERERAARPRKVERYIQPLRVELLSLSRSFPLFNREILLLRGLGGHECSSRPWRWDTKRPRAIMDGERRGDTQQYQNYEDTETLHGGRRYLLLGYY